GLELPVVARASTVFMCSECGGEALKWAGQCPHCQIWNTLTEFRVVEPRRDRQSAGNEPATARARPIPLTQVPADGEPRRPLQWGELNRVLGGGIVPGSLVLIGGEPGVGKSTLVMHLARQVADLATVLYATGEESAHQVALRARRLNAVHERLLLFAETDLEAIVAAIREVRPAVAIVDSIQTMSDPGLEAAAGTVSQVRECAARLMRLAKEISVPIFLVGHVTKEGAIAGPRVLEHMVDTVLYLEGDRHQEFRILRATKNRFGSTDEIGIFAMGESGLEEVADPSAVLVSDSSLTAGGTVVLAAVEGTRPLLVELQSLVTPTPFGLPRRSATGIDTNRLHMIVAVIEKRAGLDLGKADIFVNVAGGIRITEPAADLGLAISIVSNLRNQPVPPGTVVIGELGLTGEVRRVAHLERRLQEAVRRGFIRAIIPRAKGVTRHPGLDVIEAADLVAAIDAVFPVLLRGGVGPG
ncbi:MAG: DNA repair protein RadA, partial [Candidatus Dormibacteraeota bacterium]|nr:DNA repair protein RadA [Candidatus Dormibacteraeota bacterium]